MNKNLKRIYHETELCIIGGGLAGMIAAIAAARENVKVVLVQDRPVLGGNCSSEIRMWVRGARGLNNRETGILNELEHENIYRNPTLIPSLWDSVLYQKVKEEKNITLLLNCSCTEAQTENGRITSISAWQLTTYTWHIIKAEYFADCSGDSILAPITGAEYRVGREAASEFNESIGKETADRKTMGMSCLLQARETDHPVPFIPPSWANIYEKDEDFAHIPYDKKSQHGTFRDHTLATDGSNFWWIELGGEDDSIHDTEKVRDELLKIAFGIWDHIKNRGDHGAGNWELEWVGFLPGKRESRRYVGDYIMTQRDIEAGGKFKDIVAYGGWPMDDHNPAGMASTSLSDEPSILWPAPSPYGIPYRVLYSKNIKNLFFAGRNISVTHAALSSTRVMATCAILGQAMGTAAAMCIKNDMTPKEIYEKAVPQLQEKLLDAHCFLPGLVRKIPELSRKASLNLSEKDKAILFNGRERPYDDHPVNYVELDKGGEITYTFNNKEFIKRLRIVFDLDFSRQSVSENKKMRVFTQKLHTGLDFKPVKVPNTMVKAFEVLADGKLIFIDSNNYQTLRIIPLNIEARSITVRFSETWGLDKVHVFSCDVS
jgi:hypothetical protein